MLPKSLTQTPTHCQQCPVRARALFQAVGPEYVHSAQRYRTGQYHIRTRDHLYYQGERVSHAYTLFDGWVLLYRADGEGGSQGLRVALPGDFIGYRAPGQTTLTHSAMALTKAVLCGFQMHDLRLMLKQHPELALQMTYMQSNDISMCHDHMLGLGRKSAEERVSFLLMELFHRAEQRGWVEGNSMFFPLTQEIIGNLTGLTLVHTNRVMQKLRGKGLIGCQQQRLEIKDRAGLVDLARFQPDSIEAHVAI